jgi:hypothetical protein
MAIPNVIVFGETGAGKSSIINLVRGAYVARTSSDSVGCTFHSEYYDVSIEGMQFRFHDTAGLDEGQGGTIVKKEAIIQLYQLLRKLESGVSLLIFCMRGPRIKESCVRNWQLFWDIICQRRVPLLLAVTGLEGEKDMDAWWENNKDYFTNYMLYPNSVACITADRGKKRASGYVYDEEYRESQLKMKKAVRSVYRREPWRVGRAEWFQTVVETSIKSGKGGVEEIKTSKTVLGSATNELIDRKIMTKEEAEDLVKSLKDI